MSIAEKLREAAAKKALCGGVDHIALALTSEPARCDGNCRECVGKWYGNLADAIEVEQAKLRKHDGLDVDALLKLADEAEKADVDGVVGWHDVIRNAVKGAKPKLPEGVIWPTYEDGQLVKFGDEFTDRDGVTEKVTGFFFYEDKVFVNPSDRYSYGETVKRPEPEVLDADGVPIKVGDTVYDINGEEFTVKAVCSDGSLHPFCKSFPYQVDFCERERWQYADRITHRRPDTLEAINEDCWIDAKDYCEKYNVKTEWPKHYGKAKCEHLLARQRELMEAQR